MDEYTREPCPWRIVDDCGGAFSMGAIGGTLFQAVKGFRAAPQGPSKRLVGMTSAIKARGPVYASQFAVWGGTFSTIDCCLVKLRHKEDPWNSIASGAITGGILTVRSGWVAMAGNAVVGGLLLGMIEGISIMFTRMTADQYSPQSHEPMADPSALGPAPSNGSSEQNPGGGFMPSFSFGSQESSSG